jgi:hypothetical protein
LETGDPAPQRKALSFSPRIDWQKFRILFYVELNCVGPRQNPRIYEPVAANCLCQGEQSDGRHARSKITDHVREKVTTGQSYDSENQRYRIFKYQQDTVFDG